jgi:RNA polymerase sigma-70 factor (ECF subfamily)
VFRIQRNCFISGLRRRSVRPTETSVEDLQTDEGELDVASLLLDESDDFLAWWANPEHRVGNEILGQQIMTAIHELPAVFRRTVMLVNVDGLTYDEAAAVLGVPPGTVRSRMKRGRTLLQKALWQQARDAGLGGSDENDGDTT